MIIPTFIAYSGFAACVILAIIVLAQNHKRALNRLFFLMTTCIACVMLLAHFCYIASSKEDLVFFYRITSFFLGPGLGFILHFNLAFTRRRLMIWQYILLYAPAAVVIYTTIFDYSLFSDFIFVQGQWKFVPAYGRFGFGFYIMYNISYLLISIVLIETYRRKTVINKEKIQSLIIMLAYIFMVVSGPALAFLLPLFDMYHLSVYSPNTNIVYVFAVYFSVFKFRYLNLNPAIMADEIITNISDMIIILNTDMTVSSINEPCEKQLSVSQESAQNLPVQNLISESTDIDNQIIQLMQSKEKSVYCRIGFKKDNEEILTDSYISKIYDKFNDHTGFLIIARENRGKKQFQDAYNITEREFQVIDMVLSGLSNKVIGEKLGISERTVETHRMNIYTKLGISDRIELFRIAGEYNLIPDR